MATVTRGKILRGDLANWDGKTATATRVDATGGTITGLAIGDRVDVLQVYGSGTNRTRGTIAEAVQRIGSTSVAFVFAPGTWTIDDDLTIPSNIVCHVPHGCVLSVSSGKTLTFSGAVIADATAFYSGSGTTVLSADSIVGGRPWYARTTAETTNSVTPTDYSYPPGNVLRYGTNTTPGTTDMTAAFLAASKSSSRVTVDVDGVYLISNLVLTADAEFVLNDGVTLRHAGSASDHMIETNSNSLVIRGGTIDGNKASQSGRYDLILADGDILDIRGVHFANSVKSAIHLNGVSKAARIIGNLFDGMAEHGDSQDGETSKCIDADDSNPYVLITGNQFIGGTPSSDQLAPGGIFISGTANYVQITDNRFEKIGQHEQDFGNLIAAIQLYNAEIEGGVISGNVLVNSYYSPIKAQNASNVSITGNIIQGYLGDTSVPDSMIVWGHSRSYATSIDRSIISDNVIDIEGNTTNRCILVSGDSDGVLPSSSPIVSDNILRGGLTGIRCEWFNEINITGNQFSGQSGVGSRGISVSHLEDDEASLLIQGNTFVDAGNIFIECIADSDNQYASALVDGNIFYVRSGTPVRFVSVRGESGANVSRVTYSNNLGIGTTSGADFDAQYIDVLLCHGNNTPASNDDLAVSNVTSVRELGNSWQARQSYTTGAHSTLRDFTGTTTAAQALQLLETLVDDLKAQGVVS